MRHSNIETKSEKANCCILFLFQRISLNCFSVRQLWHNDSFHHQASAFFCCPQGIWINPLRPWHKWIIYRQLTEVLKRYKLSIINKNNQRFALINTTHSTYRIRWLWGVLESFWSTPLLKLWAKFIFVHLPLNPSLLVSLWSLSILHK